MDDPVAVRSSAGRAISKGEATPIPSPLIQSTAPLRQQKSSILKDTVDPVAAEPDTHRRLDVAPAAKPGGQSVAPSFPTEVSDLLASPGLVEPELPAVPSSNDAPSDDYATPNIVSVPRVEPDADEHLPDIHDLLPAVEPEPEPEPEPAVELEPAPAPAVEPGLTEQSDLSADASSASVTELPDETMPPAQAPESIEPAARVSGADQVTLFSFEIEEFDDSATRPELDTERPAETEEASADVTPAQATPEPTAPAPVVVAPALREPAPAPTPESNRPTDTVDTAPEAGSLEAPEPLTSLDFAPAIESDVSQPETPEPLETPEPPETSEPEALDSEASEPATEAVNPWLTATPAHQLRESVPTDSAQTALKASSAVESELIKEGTVKLLFTLKQGNFHGYIEPKDGSKDILFHQKYINADIFDQLERGVQVVAHIKHLEGKVYATRVDLVE